MCYPLTSRNTQWAAFTSAQSQLLQQDHDRDTAALQAETFSSETLNFVDALIPRNKSIFMNECIDEEYSSTFLLALSHYFNFKLKNMPS